MPTKGRLAKLRKSPSDQRTAANSGPIPFNAISIAGGDCSASASSLFAVGTNMALHSRSTALICSIKLAGDLSLHMRRQRTSVTRLQRVEPLAPTRRIGS